jgi:hypothetical protein
VPIRRSDRRKLTPLAAADLELAIVVGLLLAIALVVRCSP